MIHDFMDAPSGWDFHPVYRSIPSLLGKKKFVSGIPIKAPSLLANSAVPGEKY